MPMIPVFRKPKKPGDLPRPSPLSGKSPVFRFIILLEAALIFSIITSFIILAMAKDPDNDPGAIASAEDYHNLFKNYDVLKRFLDLPIMTEPVQDPEFEISNPFVIDFFKLKTAASDMEEKGEKTTAETINLIRDLETKHKDHPHRHGYILREKNKLLLKYLSLVKNDPELLAQYDNNPDSFNTLPLKISLINSYMKTRETEKAFTLFKELFAASRVRPFEQNLPRPVLNSLLGRLDYDYWYAKFKYLAQNNQFSEFNRMKQYVKSPQLVGLFNGEFSYRQKQYDQSRKYLAAVKDEKLLAYKERIIFKINLREKNYDPANLFEQLTPVQGDVELYQEVLLDAASILLTDGEIHLAEKFFSRYIDVTNLIQYGHWVRVVALTAESFPHKGPDYWRVVWICAWLNYQKNDKTAAVKYLQEGTYSPNFAYRVANHYWLQRLNKNTPAELDLEEYPFTYYYTLARQQGKKSPGRESLNPFITLLNHNQSRYFTQVIADLQDLVHYNLLGEAADFIRWVLSETGKNLTVSDKHTLMLIESILYMRQQNYAMAFIRFRENFECYQCIRLPRFLRGIVLPVRYDSLIQRYSKMNKVDPALVQALIREESFFRADVVSPANACGLMQLLLQTARQVAYTHRMRIYRADLFNPETNIQLGVEYLKFLLDKYKGKVHLALAAYNAGDFRVDDWLQRFGSAPDDEFVEMIPFTETRNYVKNILRNYYYYRFYYGES